MLPRDCRTIKVDYSGETFSVRGTYSVIMGFHLLKDERSFYETQHQQL